MLTYNRRLSDETRHRIEQWELNNAEIQTYHGFCTKYYGPSHNDAQMVNYTKNDPRGKLLDRLQMFDVLIIDEISEQPFCTRAYYRGDDYFDVMTWKGKKKVHKNKIKYWMPLPNVNFK